MLSKRPSVKFGVLASTALTLVAATGAAYGQSADQSCEGLLQRVEALPQELPEDVEWTIEDVRAAAESGNQEECAIIVADVERLEQGQGQSGDTAQADDARGEDMEAVEQSRTRVTLEDEAVVEGTVYLDREPANVEVTEGETEVDITPGQSNVNVNEQAAQITVREQPARITVEMAQPTIRIEQAAPEIIITMPEPGVDVASAEPQVEVRQAEPQVSVSQSSPTVDLELQLAENPDDSPGVEVEDRDTGERFAMGEARQMPAEQANVTVNRGEPIVRMRSDDASQPQVTVNRAEPQVNFERAQPEIQFSQTGEPNVEYAEAGEPKVTIRRQNQDGSEDVQESNAAAGAQETEQAEAALSATEAESDQTAMASEEAQDDEQMAEAAGSDVEAAAEEAGAEMEAAGDEIAAETSEAAQDVETAAEQAGTELEQEATGDDMQVTDAQTDDATAAQGGMAAMEGMTQEDFAGLTADELTGASLYGVDDEKIGEIAELVLAQDTQEVDGFILEVGGFLGLGQHQVMVETDKLQFARPNEGGDIRAYIDMSQEELEAMPEWEG